MASTTSSSSSSFFDGLPPLTDQYLKRLGFVDDDDCDGSADEITARLTLDNLRRLQERHLATVPFENLAQHGAVGGPQVLDVERIADKILDRGRGGFCFELNTLFGAWLEQLGYDVVWVPSIVHAGGPDGFSGIASHVVLIVTIPTKDNYQTKLERYYVDVGFGEPPLHPLRYDVLVDDASLPSSGGDGALITEEQITPDGMKSRLELERNNDDKEGGDSVVLYWRSNGEWTPRLKWSYAASVLDKSGGVEGRHRRYPLDQFQFGLETVLKESSIFAQKLIACLITRERKLTLAGNRLKVTGPPRFPPAGGEADETDETAGSHNVSVETVGTADGVRRVLEDRFGIPLSETEGLDLSKSLAADPSVWSHQ